MYYFIVFREKQIHIDENANFIEEAEVYVYFEVIAYLLGHHIIEVFDLSLPGIAVTRVLSYAGLVIFAFRDLLRCCSDIISHKMNLHK